MTFCMVGYFFNTNASNSEERIHKIYLKGELTMATLIRPSISEKNKYWIDKHRHYELKHFCLQYNDWKKVYIEIDDVSIPLSTIARISTSNMPGDPTAKRAMLKAYYSEKIKMVERIAMEADKCLWEYILKAVTEGYSYTYLKTRLGIPCGRDMYYDRYRKFFWLLDKSRL